MHVFFLASLLIAQSIFISSQDAQAVPDNLAKYTISAAGISASFIAYGARLTNLLVKDRNDGYQDVVLGYDEGSKYVNDTSHEHTFFGAVSTFAPIILVVENCCLTLC